MRRKVYNASNHAAVATLPLSSHIVFPLTKVKHVVKIPDVYTRAQDCSPGQGWLVWL